MTQSSNVDSSGDTTDRVTVTGDGAKLIMQVRNAATGAERFSLNTGDDLATAVRGGDSEEVGRFVLSKTLANGDVAVAALYNLTDDSTASAGYWTLLRGGVPIASDGTFKARGSGAGSVIRDVSAVAGNVALPALTAGDVASASASWGGVFSTDGDKVMAIFGLDYELADGAEAVLLVTFFGELDDG